MSDPEFDAIVSVLEALPAPPGYERGWPELAAQRVLRELRDARDGTVVQSGYRIERDLGGWVVQDPDGDYIMVGEHGHVAPTRGECVAEVMRRVLPR